MRGYNTDTTREFADGLAFNRNKCGTMIARLHLTGTSGGDTDLVGDQASWISWKPGQLKRLCYGCCDETMAAYE